MPTQWPNNGDKEIRCQTEGIDEHIFVHNADTSLRIFVGRDVGNMMVGMQNVRFVILLPTTGRK